ncbi:hypothetical protein [Streptomyces sp. NPDC003717]|uniref:hypothetical protein n=1 Tax=Streptomyces sp. NPDC003717 TaxID=3154276 RepID=UPI0033A17DB7
MSTAMGLRPVSEPLPFVGRRLTMRGPTVTLDYGHPMVTLRLPPPGLEWRDHLAARAPACITVGLDPLPPGAGADAIEAYLERIIHTGRARMGAALLNQ